MAQTWMEEPRRSTFGTTVLAQVRRVRETATAFSDNLKSRRELGRLSARHLRDIGLTERDVAFTGHVPLSGYAAEELEKLMHSRSSNW